MEDTVSDSVQPQQVANIVPVDKRRHFLAVFFLSFMWGTFGVDRLYLGKIWTGLLKLLTLGGFGLWTLIDLVLVMSGSMRDKQGNEMLEAERYKKFAHNTTIIFGLVMGLIVILSIVSIYLAVSQFIQNGGIEQFLPSVPGAELDNLNLEGVNLNQFLNIGL